MKHGVLTLLSVLAALSVAEAQEKKRPRIDVDSYHIAYNTEFFDIPCCEGFTILGSQIRTTLALPLGKNAELSVGAMTFVQASAESDAFEKVRPVVSLTFQKGDNRFIIGTLDTRPEIASWGAEPDGRHGLLPPIQDYTIGLERGYENGLQFIRDGYYEKLDAWVNWQKLNTADERETFDAGFTGKFRLSHNLWGAVQAHVVHDGGQLGGTTPVSDSYSFASGFILERPYPKLFLFKGPRIFREITNEIYLLRSKHTPNRETTHGQIDGLGVFYRSTIRYRNFRFQFIRWWGDDWKKREGGPIYTTDFAYWSPWKKYFQIGAFYEYRPWHTPVRLETGFRLHRTRVHELLDRDGDGFPALYDRTTMDYEYSIRAIVDLSLSL